METQAITLGGLAEGAADGGMWLVDSIQRIAAWLRQNISDVAVIA